MTKKRFKYLCDYCGGYTTDNDIGYGSGFRLTALSEDNVPLPPEWESEEIITLHLRENFSSLERKCCIKCWIKSLDVALGKPKDKEDAEE